MDAGRATRRTADSYASISLTMKQPVLLPSRRDFLVSAFAFSTACYTRSSSTFPGLAFVANKEGKNIAVVDLGIFAVIRHIPLPAEPTQVAVHPTQPFAYALTPDSGEIHLLDIQELQLVHSVHVADQLLCMVLDNWNDVLWVAATKPARLMGLAVAPLKIQVTTRLPDEPADVAIAPRGELGAVILRNGTELLTFQLRVPELAVRRQLEHRPSAVVFRSDGRLVLVASKESKLLSAYRAEDGALMVHLPLPLHPTYFCTTPDGGQLFISDPSSDSLAIVYPYRTEVAETLLAGRSPGQMACSRRPYYLFVANEKSADVTILHIPSRSLVAVAPVGQQPSVISVTPDDQYALVLNSGSGDLTVLRIPDISINKTRMAPIFLMVPVGSGPVDVALRRI